MARQASELRAAEPFVGLESFEAALDAIALQIVVGETERATDGARNHRLRPQEFLEARYRLDVARDVVAHRVELGLSTSRIDRESVSLVCYATSPTLKRSRLLHPEPEAGGVVLRSIRSEADVPDTIPVVVDSDTHLFHDVSGGFRITYGLVLNRSVVPADALSPKYKGTWLSRRTETVGITREPTGSYELHALTDGLRRRFGLTGRPLFYVRQVDDAASPHVTRELHEVVEIYVDEDVLPRLQSQRPGVATRYIAAQIAAQVYLTVLQLGGQDPDDDERVSTSVFGRALGFLQGRSEYPSEADIRNRLASDPGRLLADVQARMQQVEAAEVLLS